MDLLDVPCDGVHPNGCKMNEHVLPSHLRLPCGWNFSSPSFKSRRISRILSVAIPALWIANATFAETPDRQMATGLPLMAFDIPAQSLGTALDAYGAVTGLDVYFDGALVQGRYSAALRGSFTAPSALRILLGNTGLAADVTRPDGVTIVQGAQPEPVPIPATEDYEPYFAIVQASLGKVFCRDSKTWPGSESVVIRLWIGVDGTILRAEAPVPGHKAGRDSAFAAELQNVRLDAPPPTGMPQPLTMAILPRHPDEAGCTPAVMADEAR